MEAGVGRNPRDEGLFPVPRLAVPPVDKRPVRGEGTDEESISEKRYAMAVRKRLVLTKSLLPLPTARRPAHEDMNRSYA
jgi:hypothetical protein